MELNDNKRATKREWYGIHVVEHCGYCTNVMRWYEQGQCGVFNLMERRRNLFTKYDENCLNGENNGNDCDRPRRSSNHSLFLSEQNFILWFTRFALNKNDLIFVCNIALYELSWACVRMPHACSFVRPYVRSFVCFACVFFFVCYSIHFVLLFFFPYFGFIISMRAWECVTMSAIVCCIGVAAAIAPSRTCMRCQPKRRTNSLAKSNSTRMRLIRATRVNSVKKQKKNTIVLRTSDAVPMAVDVATIMHTLRWLWYVTIYTYEPTRSNK